MKLQNLISRLEKHHKRKIDLSLDRTFNLLKKLGNPQDKFEKYKPQYEQQRRAHFGGEKCLRGDITFCKDFWKPVAQQPHQ